MNKNIASFLALLLSITLITLSFGACAKKNSTDTETESSTDGFDLEFTDRDKDPSYDESSATKITLDSTKALVSGEGAKAEGSVVTISAAGTYVISGTLSDGQVIVNAREDDKVQLVLKNANITCSTSAPIYVQAADKVFLTLDKDSTNSLSDGTSNEDVNAAIFSEADLTLNGTGTLNITANYNHGVFSKDDLIITGGTYNITSSGDGLKGKDCVKICDGNITINSGKDGIQSSKDDDSTKGFVYICGGTFNVTAAFDGIQAETLLKIFDGTLNVVTGGGSANASTTQKGDPNADWGKWNTAADDTTSDSAKGLKCTADISIEGGTITVDSSDDSVHANNNVNLSGATMTLTSGDDGVHADNTLTIDGGSISVTKSYEGLEGANVIINGGSTSVVASDDGVNAAGGSDTAQGGRPGENTFTTSASYLIKITGGSLFVNASGDGLDSNGDMEISGGTTIVSGPTNDGNGPLDAGDNNNTIKITGGLLLAVGSTGMLDLPEENYIYSTSLSASAGTLVSVTDSDGKVLVAFNIPKQAQGIIFSNGDDGDYTMMSGGTYSGTLDANGVGTGGTIIGGSTITEGGTVTGGGSAPGGMQQAPQGGGNQQFPQGGGTPPEKK